MKNSIKGLLFASLLSIAVLAHADSSVVITSAVFQETVEKDSAGKDVVKTSELKKTIPGATVLFKNDVVNKGDKPATNIVISNPIPEQVSFVENTNKSPSIQVEYSVDGRNYAKAGEVQIKDIITGGNRPAHPDEYRYISWKLTNPLNPGEKIQVGFKAVVN